MIRLFVAIDFPREIKEQCVDLINKLKEKGYPLLFEKEENFHLTLKFLGWVNEGRMADDRKGESNREKSRIEQIIITIRGAAGEIKPFWFRPGKIGYFLRESLIIWLGVEAEGGLSQLVARLEDEFLRLGFSKEKRQFSPHVTLAKKHRATPSGKWKEIAEEIKGKYNPEFSRFRVKEVVLMESKLTKEGSTYIPIAKIPLSDN